MSRPCANAWKGCEGEVTDHAKKSECPNCRATEGRWKKRRTAEILQRHRNLTLWDHRITPLLPDDADKRIGITETPPRSALPAPHKTFTQVRKRA